MYHYKIDDETTIKVEDSTKNSKNILDKFKEVDDKYSTRYSAPTLELEKLSYNKPSDVEIKNNAEKSLSAYKDSEIKNINSSYDNKKIDLDNQLNDVKQNSIEKQSQIQNTYSKVKSNAENDAIKRGLARSSIIVNTLANYDNQMLDDLTTLSNQTDSKIQSLNLEKSQLETQKQNALNSFNIEYASKLQDKINSINEEVLKQEQAVIKYNNEIAEIQAKWEREAEQENYDRSTEMAEIIDENEYGINMVIQKEKYEIAKENFKNMTKENAINELKNNSEYKSQLGEYYYDKLLNDLNK